MKLIDYLPLFMQKLLEQLVKDQEHYGEKWKSLPREGQENRIFERFQHYWHQYQMIGEPIPWLKIAGLCMIAWLRENSGSLDRR